MIIYKITNLINGKIYIGQDIYNNPKYFGSGKLIKLSIKKYGIENFTKEIIEECSTSEELDEKEIYWIKEFNSTNREIGYNICEGGRTYRSMKGENNPMYGRKYTDEERKRTSETTKKGMTPEVCAKIKEARKHQVFSEKTRKLWSEHRRGKRNPMYGKKGELNPNFGKKCSDATKSKISEKNKGERNGMYGKNGNQNPTSCRYYIETPEGEIVIIETMKKVMEFIGCSEGFFYSKKYKKYKLIKKERINE